MKHPWPLFLLAISIFLIEISNELTTTGMFMDGLIYDNIAANMAQGIGSFWLPIHFPAQNIHFIGHPPLAFGLLALCYKIFGVHLWVCKGYSLLMYVLSGLLMLRLWERVGMKRTMGWLPLLLWVLVPMVSQYACDNMLEGTMGVFVLAAALCMFHFPNSTIKQIGWHLLAGVLLYLAFLTKGPTGLYPLCLPMIIWLADTIFCQEEKHYTFLQALGYCLLTLAVLLLCGGIVGLIQPAAFEYLKAYLSEQIVGGVSTITVGSRWYVVAKLFERTAILWVLVIVILGIKFLNSRKTRSNFIPRKHTRVFFIFLLLTLAGVIPMMVSMKQRDFYILTTIPFLAVALGALLNDTAEQWLSRGGSRFKTFSTATSVLLALVALGLNGAHWGKPGRDAELQHDVELIAEQVGRGESIAVPHYITGEYSFVNYAYRAKRIELVGTDIDHLTDPLPQYLIVGYDDPVPDTIYRIVDISTSRYRLYKQLAQ